MKTFEIGDSVTMKVTENLSFRNGIVHRIDEEIVRIVYHGQQFGTVTTMDNLEAFVPVVKVPVDRKKQAEKRLARLLATGSQRHIERLESKYRAQVEKYS